MPGSQNFVADLNNQFVRFVLQTFAGMVRVSRCFLQDGISSDHFAWDQVLADTEVFKGPLSLSAPELVRWDVDLAKAVRFNPEFRHKNEQLRDKIPQQLQRKELQKKQ